jgi:hypothetical protein
LRQAGVRIGSSNCRQPRARSSWRTAPAYIDFGVRRWQEFTGLAATLDGDGRSFDQVAAERGR